MMARYVCTVCGYVYDEAEGAPDAGIAPGTKWEDVPEDFVCPLCGVGKMNLRPSKRLAAVMTGRMYAPAGHARFYSFLDLERIVDHGGDKSYRPYLFSWGFKSKHEDF